VKEGKKQKGTHVVGERKRGEERDLMNDGSVFFREQKDILEDMY